MAAESTRIAADSSSDPFLRAKAPAPSTTVHSRAADSDRVLPFVGVSTFPLSLPPTRVKAP